MKKVLFVFLGLIFICNCLWAGVPEDEDFGIWNNNEVEVKIKDRLKITAGEELRYREAQGLYYFESRVGTSYKASEYLTIGGDYLEATSLRKVSGRNRWFWESRPRIYFTPQYKFHGWLFENRNLLEFRFKQSAQDTFRYRNRFGITAPYKWTTLELQPYATDEIFLETDKRGIAENRLYAGFKMHFYKNLYGTIRNSKLPYKRSKKKKRFRKSKPVSAAFSSSISGLQKRKKAITGSERSGSRNSF